MILKFEGVSGKAFAELVAFIHSDENVCTMRFGPTVSQTDSIVSFMSIKPEDEGYAFSLNLLEAFESAGEMKPVDSSCLLKVYEIVNQDYQTQKTEEK